MSELAHDLLLHLLARHTPDAILDELAQVLRELDQPRLACVLAVVAASLRDDLPPEGIC